MGRVDSADLAANNSAAHQLCKLNEYIDFYRFFLQQYFDLDLKLEKNMKHYSFIVFPVSIYFVFAITLFPFVHFLCEWAVRFECNVSFITSHTSKQRGTLLTLSSSVFFLQ